MNKSVAKIARIALLSLTATVVAQAKDYTFTFPPKSFSFSKGVSTTYNSPAQQEQRY